ncbi:acetylcholine receptor subunit alpha-1-B-like [Haliotis cracherodii]|uniref:acetylcholine receptor subunit alpha-1-B-like n=1 Tax=Haliotis cracherodii TaxID=6455 RepID=UPI0039E8DC30
MHCLVLLCLLLNISTCDGQRELYDHLFSNHSALVRPVANVGTPVHMTVGFGLITLENHDEIRQVFISQGVLTVTWRDETLVWSLFDFNVTRIIVPASALWVPDLIILNDVNNNGHVPTDVVSVVVHYTGDVMLSVGGRRETYCRVDVTKFPFDTQVCQIRVRQWASIDSEVRVTPKSSNIDLSEYNGNNGEYTMVHTNITTVTNEKKHQTELRFSVTFTRKSLYYIQLCVLPVILLSILNLAVFLVPSESGEKMTLGISVFLSYAVFLTIIHGFLPEISDTISIYGIYLSVMVCLKVLTLLLSVAVLNIHHNKSQQPPPSWLCRTMSWYSTPETVNNPFVNDTTVHCESWHDAARNVDRMLFFTFSIVTLTVTTGFFCSFTT